MADSPCSNIEYAEHTPQFKRTELPTKPDFSDLPPLTKVGTEVTEITAEDVTSGTLNGDGVFDKLMRAAKAHLLEEYSAQRLRGAEYASVYVQTITTTMQQAIQFTLARQQAAVNAALIEEQKLQLREQVIGERYNHLVKQAQIEQTESAINKNYQEMEGIIQRIVQSKEESKLAAHQANHECLRSKGTILSNDLINKQALKTSNEVRLLAAKTASEESTFKDSITYEGAAVPVNGTAKLQRMLYTNQAQGFLRDAEQKGAKLIIDTWNTRRATNDLLQGGHACLGDTHIAAMVTKLAKGIGISDFPAADAQGDTSAPASTGPVSISDPRSTSGNTTV